jgi:glycosyltransferase involved in cell wall biosynthesis
VTGYKSAESHPERPNVDIKQGAIKLPGLRVAYLLLWFPEPSQTFVLEEVNTLVRLGLEVRVYTLYGPRRPARTAGMARVLAPVRHLGVPAAGKLLRDLARLGRDWGPGAGQFLRQVLLRRWRSLETAGEALWAAAAGVHLAKEFQIAGIGHIHAPWADGPATAAWVASHLSGIPFSFSARARDLHPPDGALLEKLAAASLVRTNTRAHERYLAALAPREAAKIVNIYNGVSLVPEPAPPRVRQPPFRLLALGRLVPKKGYAVLLDACRLLAREGFDFHLTLAGDGPERQRLRRLIGRYGLKGRVSLPGFVPHREVPHLLQEADLFIMPSLIAPSGDRDGIPNVVLEALLHEVPVVATEISGLPEVIRPGTTGWLTRAADPERLARAMQEACADPREARRRALAGRDLVAREFDSKRNYTRLKALFDGLAEEQTGKQEAVKNRSHI